jgi:D-3-phosphoglycerate dehydrogenase
MRILLADKATPSLIADLTALGHECHLDPNLSADDLPAVIAGYEVLVVRSTVVSAATVTASNLLRLVIRAGAGTNTIDVKAAASRGVYVCNVPGRNAVAVAELTLGLILALDRNIPDNVAELRQGRWDKGRFGKADGLLGRHLAIVGLGQIGVAVAERAAAFGLVLHGLARPGRNDQTAGLIDELRIQLHSDLASLAGACDIITFHVPGGPSTKSLISKPFLDHVRPGSLIINTARGDLIDEAALIEAMETKGIRCGLDVFPDEPATSKTAYVSALAHHPNVYGTHHIGASTEQAQNAIATEVVRIVDRFVRGELLHCVNIEDQALGTATLSVRHFDEVGVLSEVLGVLAQAGLNVEQMENRVFVGAGAADAIIHVQGEVTTELRGRLEAIDRVIQVSVT